MGVNLKILSFIFPFLMFRILNIGICDALSNFEFHVINSLFCKQRLSLVIVHICVLYE